ncbi:hypothetical protein BFP72_16820 [Reichenbachiella sp. 5M10]|uniref:hypothetical protein n=1 Tax=Reichenbachiella sp. 5M10 TaxID=1889772 RepID=UPI000C154710|nr:hypothetical protein [Reichenbachiella sp. 5M10]PIB36946.1 hypothetical protein BFP72_16820 [Reichenbachiella sp. 5M10]
MASTANQKFKFGLEDDLMPQMKYLGYALLLAGVLTMGTSIFAAFLFFGLAILFMFAFGSTTVEVDLASRQITFMAGIVQNRVVNYEQLDELTVHSSQVSQQLNSRGGTNTIRYTVYRGYARIDGKRELIAESRDKKSLDSQFHFLAKAAGVDWREE